MAIGLGMGWLIAGIIYDARLRRIRNETWREASCKYHNLIERASRTQP
jgi:hypothetical protein